MPRRLAPARLRSRLTLTFTVVAAVTAVAVAAASYLVVRDARLDRATDAAVTQSRFNLDLAARTLGHSTGDAVVEELLESLQRRGGFDVVVLVGDRTYQTSLSLTLAAVPPDLRRPVSTGRVVAALRTVAGRPHVVVGGALQPAGQSFWFFFPLDDVVKDLGELRQAVTISALVMVVLSAGVGALAARRLLRPIASARDAARRWESGELDARLPAEGHDEFAELSRCDRAEDEAFEVDEVSLVVNTLSRRRRSPTTTARARPGRRGPPHPSPGRARPGGRPPPLRGRRVAPTTAGSRTYGWARSSVGPHGDLTLRRGGGGASFNAMAAALGRTVGELPARREETLSSDSFGSSTSCGPPSPPLARPPTCNLIDNALRHGRPPVEVAVNLGDTEVVVEVRDHGPGISSDKPLPNPTVTLDTVHAGRWQACSTRSDGPEEGGLTRKRKSLGGAIQGQPPTPAAPLRRSPITSLVGRSSGAAVSSRVSDHDHW